jgi:hypothetical protein
MEFAGGDRQQHQQPQQQGAPRQIQNQNRNRSPNANMNNYDSIPDDDDDHDGYNDERNTRDKRRPTQPLSGVPDAILQPLDEPPVDDDVKSIKKKKDGADVVAVNRAYMHVYLYVACIVVAVNRKYMCV